MVNINLTPHAINIVLENESVTLPPSGEVARVSVQETLSEVKNGIPFFTLTYGEVTGLPDAAAGTTYVVSGLVRSACAERRDLVSPVGLVRDPDGRVIGCQGLGR